MRRFYLTIQKGATLSHQLLWSHYIEIIKLNDIVKIQYYISLVIKLNLSVRELRLKIKNNEYERIGYKEEIEKPKVNTFIKNPIIIRGDNDNVCEYALHKLIMEDMDNFLKELGFGFAYIGNEVKIKLGANFHYIDFLLFNVKFNCYVVVDTKITKFKAEYVGQVLKYINYIDKNIKEPYHNKTVGVIICKKEDKYVLEYVSKPSIFTSTYWVKL